MTEQSGLFIKELEKRMSNQNKLRKLENKRIELVRKIQLCKHYKEKIIRFVQELNNQHNKGLISYKEYYYKLNRALEQRTPEQWVQEYDSSVWYYKHSLDICERDIKKQENKAKIVPLATILAVFMILGFGFLFLKPAITGLIVGIGEEAYTQDINLVVNESSSYEWQPDHIGVLRSARISGSILGNGSVKVYLEDKVILDSSKLEKSGISMITGLAISDLAKTNESAVFNEISENITKITEGTENITAPKTVEIKNITNITQEVPENITVPEEIEANITIPEDLINVSENITLPEENIIVPVPELAEINITEIIFTDVCIETCSLDLNKTSYELRVEIENAMLYLDNISYTIKPTELPQLNKSATLSLYNLSFTNPRILRDGVLCPSEICTKISYAAGTLIFDVTSFSAYSAEESPAAPAGGGGGGGVAVVKEKVSSFTVDKDLIKVVLRQGETKKEFLEIENTGETALDITIDLSGLKNFIIFPGGVSQYSFKLKAGEKQTVQLIFNIAEDQKPDVYPGKIIIKGDGLQTVVTTIVEIESEKPIFDIEVEILEEFKEVAAGEILLVKITLYNPEGVRLIDVSVDYSVMDLDGKVIIKEHETAAVETRTSFIKRFTIPDDVKPGNYIFYAKVTYNGVVGSSSSLFEVVEKPHVETPIQIEKYFYILYLVIAVIVVFVILMFYQYTELKKLTKSINKIRAEDLIKAKK